MRISKVMIVVAVTSAAPGWAFAMNSGSEVSLRDRQQAACYDDVQRLCGSAMPDVQKVTACMSDKRPKVSKKCSDLWDAK